METITVVLKDGVATIKAAGFRGESCQVQLGALKAKLGTVIEETPTSEAFLPPLDPVQKVSLG